jgi:hypothetical protein
MALSRGLILCRFHPVAEAIGPWGEVGGRVRIRTDPAGLALVGCTQPDDDDGLKFEVEPLEALLHARGIRDFGNTRSPRWMCQRNATCASVVPIQLAKLLKIQHETPSKQRFTSGEIFGIYLVDFHSIPGILLGILFYGNASFDP